MLSPASPALAPAAASIGNAVTLLLTTPATYSLPSPPLASAESEALRNNALHGAEEGYKVQGGNRNASTAGRQSQTKETKKYEATNASSYQIQIKPRSCHDPHSRREGGVYICVCV